MKRIKTAKAWGALDEHGNLAHVEWFRAGAWYGRWGTAGVRIVLESDWRRLMAELKSLRDKP